MNRQRAFTLIELLFTIAIIALLAGLLIPAASSFLDRGKDLKCQQNLRELFTRMPAFSREAMGEKMYHIYSVEG